MDKSWCHLRPTICVTVSVWYDSRIKHVASTVGKQQYIATWTWREMFSQVKSCLKIITSRWIQPQKLHTFIFSKMKTQPVTRVNWAEQGGVSTATKEEMFPWVSLCQQDSIKTTEKTWMESKPRRNRNGRMCFFNVSIHFALTWFFI